jgi:superfamily II DNA/RNA helicase
LLPQGTKLINKKEIMRFEDTYLNDNILDALYDMHFDECTPIQEKCIPEILNYHDVMGVAQTGTGKTAAYLLPILSLVDDGGYPKDAINCIIMSPTRELAMQIDQAMQGFGYYLNGVSSVPVYGGNDGNRYDQEMKGLKMGADVIIATPGRLLSHIRMGNIDLSRVSFFVLDEADRMLDMGFSEDIMQIAKDLPKDVQTIMFSATMPKKIQELARTLLKNPVEVKIAVSKPAEKIHQEAYICYEPQKLGIIKYLFKTNQLKRVIIFSGKKDKVKDITRELKRMHINCAQMHSDLTQQERNEVMYDFKAGKKDVLVATDIVARGIDIDDIQMVINYDVPHDAEDYVHRIGRTARADRDGTAITFVSDKDMYYFQQIESFLEKSVEKLTLPEGLGEAPEYKANARRVSEHGRGGNNRWHSSGKGNKGNKPNARHGKPNAKASDSGAKANNPGAKPNSQKPRHNNPKPRQDKPQD